LVRGVRAPGFLGRCVALFMTTIVVVRLGRGLATR
jgi:hypothetical protein